MHNTENLDRFVELRAQGPSVPKISEKLGIPASTLYDWDERVRARIQNLRLVALEQLEDRILGTQNAQCEAIASHLKAIDKQIGTEIDNGTIEPSVSPNSFASPPPSIANFIPSNPTASNKYAASPSPE